MAVSLTYPDGYDAVLLWQRYREGSKEALDLLLEYNKEDTVNLFSLAEIIYEQLRRSTGIDNYASKISGMPEVRRAISQR